MRNESKSRARRRENGGGEGGAVMRDSANEELKLFIEKVNSDHPHAEEHVSVVIDPESGDDGTYLLEYAPLTLENIISLLARKNHILVGVISFEPTLQIKGPECLCEIALTSAPDWPGDDDDCFRLLIKVAIKLLAQETEPGYPAPIVTGIFRQTGRA